MKTTVKNKSFGGKITILKWQVNVFGLSCLMLGLLLGAYLIVSGKIRHTFASDTISYEIKTKDDFIRSGSTLQNVTAAIDGSGAVVSLEDKKNSFLKITDQPDAFFFYSNNYNSTTGIVQDEAGNIYVDGGSGGDSSPRQFWRYKFATSSWEQLANMSFPLAAIGPFVYGGKDNNGHERIFQISKFGNTNSYGNLEKYDINTNSWSTLHQTPNGYSLGGSMVYDGGNYLYVTQGMTWNANIKGFWRYNISTDSWDVMQETPEMTDYGKMVYDGNGHIYVMQGYGLTGPMLVAKLGFWKYDVATNSWSVLPDLPIYFDSGNIVSDGNGHLYASQSKNFYKFTLSSETWAEDFSLIEDMVPTRYYDADYFVYRQNKLFLWREWRGDLGYIPLQSEFQQPASWESAPVDLGWNSGWVGVSDFIADLDTPNGTSLFFQMKTADTAEQLASAEYKPVEVASGAAQKSISIDLASKNIDTKRFAQLKVSFVTEDISDMARNPQLKKITLNYNTDTTAPVAGNLDITFVRNNDGAIIPGDGFTNENSNNYTISWQNASTDDAAGIVGYCANISDKSATDPAGDPAQGAGILWSSFFSDPNEGLNGGVYSEAVWNWETDHWVVTYRSTLPGSLLDIKKDPNLDKSGCQFVINKQEGEVTSLGLQEIALKDLFYNPGPNYINLKAIDKAGNVSNDSVSFAFKIDDQNPNVMKYLMAPSGFLTSKDITISWPAANTSDGVNDIYNGVELSGIAGYQYRIRDEGWNHVSPWYGLKHTGSDYALDDLIPADATSYTMQSQFLDEQGNPMMDGDGNELSDYANLFEGDNYFELLVCDKAGNCNDNDKSRALIKINTVAPSEPQDLQVTTANQDVNAYAFSWKIPSVFPGKNDGDNGSKLDYCYTVNQQPSKESCNFTAPSICKFNDPDPAKNGVCNLPEDAFATQPGENTFYVAARYGSSINYAVYSTVKFYYTGSAPGIPKNFDVSDISNKDVQNWKLALSWGQPNEVGAGVASYKIFRSETKGTCSENPRNFQEVGSSIGTTFVDAGLEQKDYYYCARACDSANNCSAVSTTATKMPTGKFTEPAKLITGPSVTAVSTSKATIEWTTERKSDSRIAYSPQNENFYKEEPSNSDQVISHSINLSNLSPGKNYHFKAKWTDEDGNIGTSEEKTFRTAAAPTVKNAKANNVGISSAIIHFTTKGARKVKLYYGTSPSFGGVKELATGSSESTYDIKLDNLSDDTKYYYKINTFDSEGAEYNGTTFDFTTFPKPKISEVKLEELKNTAQPTIVATWQTNTETTSVVSYVADGSGEKAKQAVDAKFLVGEHKLIITNLLPEKNYTITVSGVDKLGNAVSSDNYSLETANDTRPPLISELNSEGIIVESKNQNEAKAQLVVSWNTDEAATSQIEYGEGAGGDYAQKTQEDANLTLNHLVIVSGLAPSKVYHFRVVSKDAADNEADSLDNVMITPKAVDNALDLVIVNLQEIFGFLGGLRN